MIEEHKQASSPRASKTVDYARRVHSLNMDWYKNADAKAEIILSLDGVFLAFVVSSIFMNQDDLVMILGKFSWVTWSFLILMAVNLAGSICTAIACLWSRISFLPQKRKEAKDAYFKERKIVEDQLQTYPPEITLFFQKIDWVKPEWYQKLLLSADEEYELKALAGDISVLSHNVMEKHILVDVSFLLAGLSLLFFLGLGISYLAIIQP